MQGYVKVFSNKLYSHSFFWLNYSFTFCRVTFSRLQTFKSNCFETFYFSWRVKHKGKPLAEHFESDKWSDGFLGKQRFDLFGSTCSPVHRCRVLCSRPIHTCFYSMLYTIRIIFLIRHA